MQSPKIMLSNRFIQSTGSLREAKGDPVLGVYSLLLPVYPPLFPFPSVLYAGQVLKNRNS